MAWRCRYPNVAQDIALSIRQAQLYGISAGDGVIGNSDYLDSGFNVSGTALVDITQDRSIRGVSFDLNNDPVVMTIYEDIDRDGRYIDGSDRVIDKRSIISNDISLASFCLDELLGLCGSTKTNGILDITFERPYTDATVLYRTNSSSTPSSYNTVGLVIEADGSGKDIQVDVSSIGKISVH